MTTNLLDSSYSKSNSEKTPSHRSKKASSVFAFLQQQVNMKNKMKRYGTANNYDNAYRRFREFRNDIDLTFSELSPEMIEHYEAWLIDRRQHTNTIRFYLRTLHTLLARAIDKRLLKDRQLFRGVHLSYVTTIKRAITEQQLIAIAHLPLPPSSMIAFARDIFMFSFYMRGMSFVDIAYLRKSDIKSGMISYCRSKTNQQLHVAIEQASKKIIERYAHQTISTPYLLPILTSTTIPERQQYKRMLENVNRHLKEIGERVGLSLPLTTYVARHTWASIARDLNISIAIISEGMGHRSYKTTQTYLNSLNPMKINEANKQLIQRIYPE